MLKKATKIHLYRLDFVFAIVKSSFHCIYCQTNTNGSFQANKI